ncbi:PhnB protein [Serratia fonticola]|jgi:PhnB protein|uniref:PhnB protein n=1 Tax=Serratia fonticola TaxID=47917 RepID=A0A559T9P1_SERFO|nr:VOC family protein [Serratia fonticola]TQI81144.1 PhnB protein [Serratia fonticola]TQI96832.1 PhnB protein [Serratia fonticola]TVZ71327.1 PhnB protein [Serratia fonticola]
MLIQPYLFFSGNCEQAVNFYAQQLNGTIEILMRYQDMPAQEQQNSPPNTDPLSIMHARLVIGDNVIMASDSCPQDEAEQSHRGYALSIRSETVENGRELFTRLAEGGSVTLPFQPTFWAKGFGMLTDKFGVNWMINVE